MQQWQEFCEAPEERQRAILMGLDKARRSRLTRSEYPHERYEKIDRRVKALLKVLLPQSALNCFAISAAKPLTALPLLGSLGSVASVGTLCAPSKSAYAEWYAHWRCCMPCSISIARCALV